MTPKDKPDKLEEILLDFGMSVFEAIKSGTNNPEDLKTQETLAQINALYISREEALEAVGEDEHSMFGEEDDTDYCRNRNELRAEIRTKLRGEKS